MNPQVLLVDDSLTVRMDLRAALTSAGFAIKTCSTLEAARTELAHNHFDLATLDVLLPDGSGIDLLKQIKETPELRATRVIMLSTEAEVGARIAGLRLGADRYVGKPYERSHLVRMARELLKMSDGGSVALSRRTRKKLLLVDDSPTFLGTLAETLRQDGYEVVTAVSGEEAIALLAIEQFDIVLLDLIMPGMDGMQTCRQLRGIKRLDSCLIVMMTACEPDAIIRADALAAGADELIFKSARLSALSAQLLCILILKRQQLRPGMIESGPGAGVGDSVSARRGALLYRRLIAASGLSEMLAKSLINSAFYRIGIDPTISELITPANLQRALASIGQTLRVFLPSSESLERIAGIAALANGSQLELCPSLSAGE